MAVHAALVVARSAPPDSIIVVLLPDTGRNYLTKFFSDEWMRQNGFLDRLRAARVGAVAAAHDAGDGAVPSLVAVEVGRTVGEAIDLMQRYNISQLPVVDGTNGDRQV